MKVFILWFLNTDKLVKKTWLRLLFSICLSVFRNRGRTLTCVWTITSNLVTYLNTLSSNTFPHGTQQASSSVNGQLNNFLFESVHFCFGVNIVSYRNTYRTLFILWICRYYIKLNDKNVLQVPLCTSLYPTGHYATAFVPQLHDTGLLFISDYITTMFDFAADFGTDVRNVLDSASYTATGTCRFDFYIASEAEWFSHDGTYRIAMVFV